MIVITGAGRSGTAAVGLLYQQLGFDLGGEAPTEDHSGLEGSDFWRLNNRLAVAMGMTMLHPARTTAVRPSAPPVAASEDRRGRRGARRHRTGPAPFTPTPPVAAVVAPSAGLVPRVRLADWDRLPQVLEEHREQMLHLAARTAVAQDSRFLWTLPVWLAAGAPLDHVVITARAMADMVTRPDAGESPADDTDVRFTGPELRNALSYGLGVATTSLLDAGTSHAILRFPEFVSDLDGLYAGLRFPTPVSAGRFRATARRVFDHQHLADISVD